MDDGDSFNDIFEEENNDCIDMLINAIEIDECTAVEPNTSIGGRKRELADTISHEMVSRDDNKKLKEEAELSEMKAKMDAMEAELVKLKGQLHQSNDTKRSSAVAPMPFKKGKRVAHETLTESAPLPKRRPLIEESKEYSTDKYSGLKVSNPLISSELMNERMKGRKLVRIPQIMGVVKDGDVEGDWVTIGVIVSKSVPRNTCKGKKFSIWRLSDLSSQLANVSFFLFDKVFQTHWKTPIGHVIAILNANIMTNRDTNSTTGESSSNKYSLSLDNPAKLMDMGVSYDFVICKATTKSGKPCQNYASKQNGGYCDYHIQKEYGKMRSNRMNCQGGYGPSTESLQKKLLGHSDVFYGGQSYSGRGAGGAAGKNKGSREKGMQQRMFAPGVRKELKEVEELLGTPVSDLGIERKTAGDDIFKQLMKGQTPGALCLNRYLKTEKSRTSLAILEKEKSALLLLQEHSQKKTQSDTTKTRSDATTKTWPDTTTKTRSDTTTKTRSDATTKTRPDTIVKTRPDTTVKTRPDTTTKTQPDATKRTRTSVTKTHTDATTKTQTKVPRIHSSLSLKKPSLSSSEDFELFRPDNLVITDIPRGVATTTPTNATATSPKEQSPSPPTVTKKSILNKMISPTQARSIAKPLKTASLINSEKNKEKAIAILREKGPLKKDDPNITMRGKILNDDKQTEIRRKMEEKKSERETSKENVMTDNEFEKILNAKSSHNWTVMEDDQEKQESYFNNLEKKEQMQERLLQITELNVQVVQCKKCNYISESVGGICRSENHQINRLRAMKRCFKCGGCGQRMFTYNERYPIRSCQCGDSSKFQKCSLYKEKTAPKLPSEVLLVRGHEQKFLNSLN